MDKRVCKRCGQEAPISDFVKITGGDGYSEVCMHPDTCEFLKAEMAKSSINPMDPGAKPGEPGFSGRPSKAG
jgi:hypothetical protein